MLWVLWGGAEALLIFVPAGDDGERRERELEDVNQLLSTTEEAHRLRAPASAAGPHSPPEMR